MSEPAFANSNKHRMINKFLLFTFTYFFLIGKINAQYCSTNSRYTEVAYFDSTQISVGANVQFGTAPDHLGNPYPLKMDLYYPNLIIDTSPKRPFILLLHGGGFSSGDKQSGDIKDLCIHLARRGFVCATMNYRLGHDFSEYGEYKARYRAIQDGHAAMRYLVNSANTLRIDTAWLFVGGQSAGALAALGMVYADQWELDSISLLYNTVSTSVQLGNLFNSGNTLTNTYTFKGIFNNWGAVAQSEMDVNEMLPTVAFHGAQDTTVLIDTDNSFLHYQLDGSRSIHYKLIAQNICSEISIDLNGEHGIYRNASSVFRAQRASCFFKSIFCNNCSNFYSTDSIPTNCSSPLGVNHFNQEVEITVYPNPFGNGFKMDGVNGVCDVRIYNSFGQLVYHNEKSNGLVVLDVMPGMYFLNLRQAGLDKIITKKLIKQ
ncbi:MAG: T9SS type A sorting domain-containing protein [Bacteroidia bacterium]|nr:T9SS type A sorting domain-containing protein [Bacteroidia bacterium]